MSAIQSVFVLLAAIGVTMPFLVIGAGRPWLRQSRARWPSGWWTLAAAVAFASASICLTFALLVGVASRESRVGQLEAAAPWLGGPVRPGGWALLIVTYLVVTGAAFVIAWRRGRWKSLPATVDAATLRRLVLDGHDHHQLRDLYAHQFPGDSFDSIVALADCSREAGRMVTDAGMRYTRALGGLTANDLNQMTACAHATAHTDNLPFARTLLQRLRAFVARLDAAPNPGNVHWADLDQPHSATPGGSTI